MITRNGLIVLGVSLLSLGGIIAATDSPSATKDASATQQASTVTPPTSPASTTVVAPVVVQSVAASPTPTLTPAATPTARPTSAAVATPKPVATTPVPRATSASCDPNYSGCVPIASDVDCAGGSGNGPAYARGPVRVIGSDIYDLDRDGDGVACE